MSLGSLENQRLFASHHGVSHQPLILTCWEFVAVDNFDFLLRDEVYNEKKERPEADFLFHKGFYGLKESEKIKEELNSEVYKLLTQGYVNTHRVGEKKSRA